MDGVRDPWEATSDVKPGDSTTFVVPVPEPAREPAARVRAVLSAKNADGAPSRISLMDANVLKRAKGSGRGRIDGVVAVTFRYEYDDANGLRVTLATDPYSTVSLDGRALGTTPVVGAAVAPGAHTFRLHEHGATVSVRFDR